MILWKCWNRPSYSSECWLYWLRWHLVVKTSSLTDIKGNFASRYYRLWMWRHAGTQRWSCLSAPTDYGNSHASGCKIQNTLITGHFSQLRMSGSLWSMSWKYWGHFDIRPCGCQRGLQSHCITWSRCTMTCLIIWTVWFELPRRRSQHARKTCSSPWSQFNRSCLNTTLKWLQRRACYKLLHIFSIRFGLCDRLENGTSEWISILRMRHSILPNTKRPFWSLLRMNTVPNINVCRSISTKAHRAAIPSPRARLQDPINHPLIQMIGPAMMENT